MPLYFLSQTSIYSSCFPYVFQPFWILTLPQLRLLTIFSPFTCEKSPLLVAFFRRIGSFQIFLLMFRPLIYSLWRWRLYGLPKDTCFVCHQNNRCLCYFLVALHYVIDSLMNNQSGSLFPSLSFFYLIPLLVSNVLEWNLFGSQHLIG